MEHIIIKDLLEKYWQAETSVEEERQLKAYFRGPSVAPELEAYRAVFGYFGGADAGVQPSADLEERILKKIARPAVRNLYTRGWWYAAAAILVVCLGIGLSREVSTPARRVAQPQTASAVISDTYADPAQALAAVQKALRTASTRMNKGREMTRSGMGRLGENYRLAFKD